MVHNTYVSAIRVESFVHCQRKHALQTRHTEVTVISTTSETQKNSKLSGVVSYWLHAGEYSNVAREVNRFEHSFSFLLEVQVHDRRT